MVTIIDYGIGNLRSIEKAFEQVGADVLRTDRPDDLMRAERLVLPGVGAFGACADEIRRRGLVDPIREAVAQGTPLLGVCVGMQLLFEVGEEMGEHAGLGLLKGRVVRFAQTLQLAGAPSSGVDRAEPGLKVPHMGWNTIEPRGRHPLLLGLPAAPYFYFVHSYHAAPADPTDILATCDYGASFPAVVGRNRVFGVQFHPEKSQSNGLTILRNFKDLPR